MTVIPAYGRDYKSQKEVKDAWETNQDFQIVGIHRFSGAYVSKADLEKHGQGESVTVRYAKMRKALVIR